MDKKLNSEIKYHIGLSEEMIQGADCAILANDHRYIEPLAKLIDNDAEYLNENREYLSYLVDVDSTKVLVMSMGLGGPPAGIGLEELALIGIKYILFLGETIAIQPNIHPGDLIVPKGVLRLDGTSEHYAPKNYPASASLSITNIIRNSLNKTDISYHSGIIACTDTFYPISNDLNYQCRYSDNVGEWRDSGVLSLDLSLATVFTVCNVFDIEASAVLDVVKNYYNNDVYFSLDERINNWKKYLLPIIKTQLYAKIG